MVFDLVGWTEATPGTGVVGVTAALADTQYPAVGDAIVPKKYATLNNIDISLLIASFGAACSTGAAYRFAQPGLTPGYYEARKVALEALDNPALGYDHMFGRPLPVFANVNLTAQIVNATDETAIIGAWLASEKITKAMLDAVNPTHKLTGYSDTTLTALTWTAVPITWNEDLPAGTYAIVGMKVGVYIAAGELATLARLVLPDSPYRPGVVASLQGADHEELQTTTVLRMNDWPLMPDVSFDHQHMPNIECLSNAAMTDEDIELTLQKIA